MSRSALKAFTAKQVTRNKGYETIRKNILARNEQIMKEAHAENKRLKREVKYEDIKEKNASLEQDLKERRKPTSKFKQFLKRVGEKSRTAAPTAKGFKAEHSPVRFNNNNNVIKRDANFNQAELNDRLTLGVQRRQ